MAFEFKLPDLGEGVAEGEVVRWLVREGDTVSEDQPLAELLTDKATVEIPSPRAGRIAKLGAAEGERVPVGHVLVVIEEEDSGSNPETATWSGIGEATAPATASTPGEAAEAAEAPAGSPSVRPIAKDAAALLRAVEATPAVRALARELGVDLAQVQGTGPGGRIVPEDVRRTGSGRRSAEPAPAPAVAEALTPAAPAPPVSAAPTSSPVPPTPAPASADEERIPLRGLRRRVAEAMTKSHTSIPQFTFVAEADVTDLVADRESRKEEAKAAGVKLTFVSYVVRALCPTLHAHPLLNATLDEERQEIVVKKRVHVAVAVATPEGLTVPVVKDAERLELFDLAREIERLAEAGRQGRLKPEELSGATFTVTTTGAKGGVLATPLVHHPQVAILGIHAVAPRPAVRDGQIVARQLVNLSLSMDHRVVDGQVGADFLYDLIARLESVPSLEPARREN